ncbi:hypothetical protein OG601_19470 [Streptomyces sp. NBC_01239]|uniref:hypothetical protein n=1 Tax=Streptomyces sp. NBC_01239 TaxID=2903792 RepID=UPI00225A828C|nr:hypothetical protein [Streptomyces sp. NBC_01239]MCX4812777.1 hypothetical protein [Streptomyces sp. NBC_01239]
MRLILQGCRRNLKSRTAVDARIVRHCHVIHFSTCARVGFRRPDLLSFAFCLFVIGPYLWFSVLLNAAGIP